MNFCLDLPADIFLEQSNSECLLNENEKKNKNHEKYKNHYTRYQSFAFGKCWIFLENSPHCLFIKKNKPLGSKDQEKNRNKRRDY